MQTNTANLTSEFVTEAANRAGLEYAEFSLYVHSKANEIVHMCVSIVAGGGGAPQMVASLADYYEDYPKGDREFAGLIASQCVKVIAGRVGKDAGTAISQAFVFPPDMPDPVELRHEIWSYSNPSAYHVDVKNWREHISEDQWRQVYRRFSESLESDFGDNNGVVVAFNAVQEPDIEGDQEPTDAAIQRWQQAFVKAKAHAMAGLPADLPIEFEVITYLTM